MNSGIRLTITKAAAATLLLGAVPRLDAAVIVPAPVLDSREWTFTLTSVGAASPWWVIQFGDDRLDPGDWLGIYFYEGSATGDPVWQYVRHNTWDSSLDGVFKSDLTEQGFFAGGWGTVRFELYAGTVEIWRVRLYTEIGGASYTAGMMEPFTLTPEPGTVALVLVAGCGLAARRGRRAA